MACCAARTRSSSPCSVGSENRNASSSSTFCPNSASNSTSRRMASAILGPATRHHMSMDSRRTGRMNCAESGCSWMAVTRTGGPSSANMASAPFVVRARGCIHLSTMVPLTTSSRMTPATGAWILRSREVAGSGRAKPARPRQSPAMRSSTGTRGLALPFGLALALPLRQALNRSAGLGVAMLRGFFSAASAGGGPGSEVSKSWSVMPGG